MANKRLRKIEFHGDVALDFDTIAFTLLSSLLASIALLTGSVPILIGAMVMAPTFDPLIAIPFGLVTRNWRLAAYGSINTVVLFAIALLVCLGTVQLAILVPLLTTSQGIMGIEIIRERLQVSWGSVITAAAAGAGGALAFAAERRLQLVGVVITIALIPSLAAAAIAFVASPLSGWGGIALFGVNVGGIIIAGFLILLLRMKTGEQQEKQAEQRATDEHDR